MSAKISGLDPNSKHGFHIHNFGDQRAANGSSAGGHYNPEGHKHGLPPTPFRHAGSYGNLESNANGVAVFEFIDDTISVSGRKNPILGRGLVVHAESDKGTQPSGGAGARIGVGVIGIANPEL